MLINKNTSITKYYFLTSYICANLYVIYVLSGFALTTHTSQLLGGWRRRTTKPRRRDFLTDLYTYIPMKSFAPVNTLNKCKIITYKNMFSAAICEKILNLAPGT
jgi:hypothetical protein